jgi:DNA-directed RNA polymerase alpha subunit
MITCPRCGHQFKKAGKSFRSRPVIEVMNLSRRTQNSLLNAKIETIGDLIDFPMGRLLREPNFGKRSFDEVLDEFDKAQKGNRK